MRHRLLLSVLAPLVSSAVAVATLPPGGAAAATPSSPPTPATARAGADIALKAGAYGTRLSGGDVPAGSGATALAVVSCSTQPGSERTNDVATVDIPGLGEIGGVRTRAWTRQDRSGALHSYSRSSTAEVVLADTPIGRLSIRGITSLSHAWYDGKRFHADTQTSVGAITFQPPGGTPQVLDLPTPGSPVTVPGLARIRVGDVRERTSATAGRAWAVALRVQILPTGTDLFVARSKAEALAGVRHGRFGGYAAGTEASVLGGVLTSGRNPVSLMPCQGTGGKVQGKDDIDLDLGGGLHVEGVSSKQWAQRSPKRSKAWTQGSVAGIDLGGGALVVDAVVGKATVTRAANGKRTRSAQGTRIGSITVDGQAQELPLNQTIEIPGLARLEPRVVERTPAGLKVVALRITLLDGAGAVIDLGVAKATIKR